MVHIYYVTLVYMRYWTQSLYVTWCVEFWLTHRGPGHQLLDELSNRFTTLDGSDTIGRVVAQYLRIYLDQGSVLVHLECI